MSDRTCFWCREEIPEGGGLYDAIIYRHFHAKGCADAVTRFYRDYSKSKRGRLRSAAYIRRLIVANRPNPDSIAVCADWLEENGFAEAARSLRGAFTRGGS